MNEPYVRQVRELRHGKVFCMVPVIASSAPMGLGKFLTGGWCHNSLAAWASPSPARLITRANTR